MSEPTKSNSNSPLLHEDWATVVLGVAIIAVYLFGGVLQAPSFGWGSMADISDKIFTGSNLGAITLQFLFTYIVAAVAAVITNKNLRYTLMTFPILFLLTTIALILAGNSGVKSLNLEAVIFSLAIGLIVGNLFELPAWFSAALSTELYVKIGLVLLGTSVIFTDILKAGSLGLLQALVVVVSVWYFAYWICRKLAVDDELAMMISSAVSICGVSAAIATAGAIQGDNKKLSYVISLVLITAIPMMIVMPWVAHHFDFSQEVTGAWLGGSIDTTGAVVASGTLVGETALKISTIVKFSQNVLLGLAAFAISIYWTYSRKEVNKEQVQKPTLAVIWERFPKFIIGFMGASLLFSFFLSPEQVSAVKDGLKSFQTLWFVLAFTSIGLETKFKDLFNSSTQRPFYAFLIAQTFNIIITLIVATLLFGQ
ncbi:MAG: putative sulfate exporter family transporter [Chryseolinea sp.]